MKAKLILLLIVFLPLLGCDRYSKDVAVDALNGHDPLVFLNGVFSLTYHENSGGMLSLGAGLPENIRFIIFNVLVGLILLGGLVYVLVKPMDKFSFVVGLLILSGGLGNLYDRVMNDGRVVDFMLLQVGPLKTGVFNVADIAIMAGLFGFIILSTKLGQKLSNHFN